MVGEADQVVKLLYKTKRTDVSPTERPGRPLHKSNKEVLVQHDIEL